MRILPSNTVRKSFLRSNFHPGCCGLVRIYVLQEMKASAPKTGLALLVKRNVEIKIECVFFKK